MGSAWVLKEDQPRQHFEFGKNWHSFLKVVDEERIAEAENSLRAMLETDSLAGKSFLDAGAGSGLFSLAAVRLGAVRVHSFDYDAACVACARELKRRYAQDARQWTIERGSVLDNAYLSSLEQFDIVYCWGVLHYCGDMWKGMANVVQLVMPGGKLFVAVFNDQGVKSRRWNTIKRLYNSGIISRVAIGSLMIAYFVLRALAEDALWLRNPLVRYRMYKKRRGMSMVHDWFGWLGGYPWEGASPEAVFEFYKRKSFVLTKLKTAGGKSGNNQFVFLKTGV